MGSVNGLLSEIPLPDMLRVRQHFQSRKLENPALEVRRVLARPELAATAKPGMRIAVTAGSRGIDNIALITREVLCILNEWGAYPFLVPAMGSHGGATAEGQIDFLRGYGITEERMGVPILSSMETTQVGTTPGGEPVYADKNACGADGIVLINRIKPHTGFRGDYESGLVKMAAIGLGKQKGAEAVHSAGPEKMAQRVCEFGSCVIRNTPVLFGIGIVENSFDKTCGISALTVPEIFEREPLLLQEAKAMMPTLRFEKLDLLIIDRIGKNISGPGMDPNISYTFLSQAAIPEELRVKRAKRVVVLDLTDETHGSAMGIGMADIITKRAFEKMDLNATYPNCLTGAVTESAKIPMMFDSQRLAIQAAIKTLQGCDKSRLRIVRIRDTLHISEIEISDAMLEEARLNPSTEILSAPSQLRFDTHGNLFE